MPTAPWSMSSFVGTALISTEGLRPSIVGEHEGVTLQHQAPPSGQISGTARLETPRRGCTRQVVGRGLGASSMRRPSDVKGALATGLIELLVHPRVFHPHSRRASSWAQVHEGIPPLRR